MIDFAANGIACNPHGSAEQRVPCPHCDRGPRDEALGVNVETGTYHCFRCNWKGRVGGETGAPVRRVTRYDDPAVAERKRERLRRTWRESVPLSDRRAWSVCRYLESRALGEILKAPPAALRAHPALEYWDRTDGRWQIVDRFPAMVGLFHGTAGDPVTLHVTYLRQDGCAKAPVLTQKKILEVAKRGATRGGAIRLYGPQGGRLGIAEGIESALSLHLLRQVPVWAAYCADNMARIRLPEDLRELQIGVDMDANGTGQRVAEELAKGVMRWSRRTRVLYVTPDLEGPGDLNDELRRRAG